MIDPRNEKFIKAWHAVVASAEDSARRDGTNLKKTALGRNLLALADIFWPIPKDQGKSRVERLDADR